ncbi:MAG: hypothetical protein LBT53_02095 [Puniceicoccales bacterium]|jgi:hypothetical protein|nr:hypothetical protein [Puniceicoccales bacterium]
MASKVDMDIVEAVLSQNVDVYTAAKIIEQLKKEQEEAAVKDAEKKEIKPKKQYIPVISDPNGELEGKDIVGWVIQLLEEENPATTMEKLITAAYDYNTTKKGAKDPALTIADVCERVPPKVLKEQQIWVKTKEPVSFIITDNVVPMETTDKKVDRRKKDIE